MKAMQELTRPLSKCIDKCHNHGLYFCSSRGGKPYLCVSNKWSICHVSPDVYKKSKHIELLGHAPCMAFGVGIAFLVENAFDINTSQTVEMPNSLMMGFRTQNATQMQGQHIRLRPAESDESACQRSELIKKEQTQRAGHELGRPPGGSRAYPCPC